MLVGSSAALLKLGGLCVKLTISSPVLPRGTDGGGKERVSMEEADLLKERLQAITDKRRVQEDIAQKRRQIEEEKLKLQYLKKKALREQWLMDGLSGQSEEEQEAMRTQAQDDQQQTTLLQTNITRIEEEIEALEAEEIRISQNEGLILKRLKEVERTPADIIKEVNAEMPKEPVQYKYSTIPDLPKNYRPLLQKKRSPKQEPDGDQKRGIIAMEISVELDHRTGQSQVLSSNTITTDDLQHKGIKVFDDGRKSVYALSSDGRPLETNGGVEELSPSEVDELLRKATEKKKKQKEEEMKLVVVEEEEDEEKENTPIPTDVQYHEPVYSSPYHSRSNTPRRSDRDQNSPAPNGLWTPHTHTPSPLPADREATPSPHPAATHIPDPRSCMLSPGKLSPYSTPRNGQMNGSGGAQRVTDGNRLSPAWNPIPMEHPEEIQCGLDSELELGRSPPSPLCPTMEEDTRISVLDALPCEPSEPITMIFMGYQTAQEEEEEDEGYQAELIVIADDDEDDRAEVEEEELEKEDYSHDPQLSYHPEGYHSKVFSPSKANVHRSEVKPSGLHERSRQRGAIPRMEDPTAAALRLKLAQLGKQA
ncbi:palmdelphin-like isoform X2 [Engraulis encrasicolus]|uniref:palmdelphin-like isoform X2 n=1 Tax=Engraulis encrasicolus TaxID=184585 RepID=UPI002FD03FA7